jgi:urease accessory protein UreF
MPLAERPKRLAAMKVAKVNRNLETDPLRNIRRMVNHRKGSDEESDTERNRGESERRAPTKGKGSHRQELLTRAVRKRKKTGSAAILWNEGTARWGNDLRQNPHGTTSACSELRK